MSETSKTYNSDIWTGAARHNEFRYDFNFEVGIMVPNRGIYLGSIDSLNFRKNNTTTVHGPYHCFAAPQDFDFYIKQKVGARLHTSFAKAAVSVANVHADQMMGWGGLNHFQEWKEHSPEEFLHLSLMKYEELNRGKWCIPPKHTLDLLYQFRDKGALAGSFSKIASYLSCDMKRGENFLDPSFKEVSVKDFSHNGAYQTVSVNSNMHALRLVRYERGPIHHVSRNIADPVSF